MLDSYRQHVLERAARGLPPRPLTEAQTKALCELLTKPIAGEEALLLELLASRVPPGVDDAARVKGEFLTQIALGTLFSPIISPVRAVELLGTMQGGYNVAPLVRLLGHAELGATAALQLSRTLLVSGAFDDVAVLARSGNAHAASVLLGWANGTWFAERQPVQNVVTLTVFKVPGETTTDDLSPAPEAWSRTDVPEHALTFLKNPREGVHDALEQLEACRRKGHRVAYVGDVVGTGSSRKSAVNSLSWHIGQNVPHVPNKRSGGFVLGGKIAPIFGNTLQDAGALPIECDVSQMQMGDIIRLFPHEGRIEDERGVVIARFELRDVLLDEVRAGGRIQLIIGRSLFERARKELGLGPGDLFRRPGRPASSGRLEGYTLAQKMVGRACGVVGIRPGEYCEPKVAAVGSQDTTGPMTREELKQLGCLEFSADLVLQTFCHTAAYPTARDVESQETLTGFFEQRGAIVLRPGDGIIHSWLNRMLLPDQVGTGADSHTRFPLGISFPGGSGLVAFAAAFGMLPLDMPESVLVRFKGELQPGITLRDLVNAIPRAALLSGDLTVAKQHKKNVFSGRIIEIEGQPSATVEQAFELSDSTAERSAAACTIRLGREPIAAYLKSNVALLRWLIAQGYGHASALEKRARAMEAWLAAPTLLEPDPDARYHAVFEIDLATVLEPLVACPNDPDDIRPLGDVAGTPIDEVFVGSCMSNIGHFRAVSRLLERHGGPVRARLWVAPPTRMDEAQLRLEGHYNAFALAGARTEVPGCSLCMGNQARVRSGATVLSTSTRNFPNRLGTGAQVFLGSAELAAVAAILGRLPTREEYFAHMHALAPMAASIYRYLGFDGMPRYCAAGPVGAALRRLNVVPA